MSEVITRLFSALADRYHIEREIGSGGMATVYLARDLKHDRDVALKVLRPELAALLGIDRFLNEIRISARLDHPPHSHADRLRRGERGSLLRPAFRSRRIAARPTEARKAARRRRGTRHHHQFEPLPDGAVCIMPADGRSISIIQRPGNAM